MTQDAVQTSRAAVAAHDEETFQIVGGRANAGLVIVCDHGGNAFPPGYGTLGLPASELKRHIAYDIGAGEVTRRLAVMLDCPALITRYSRLLIDLNRGADDPTLVMRISDGAIIPGNRQIDLAEREARIARFYRPYHAAIDRVLDTCLAQHPPALLSIHSFTPVWRGTLRPWHAAVLWDVDGRFARPLLDALRAETDGLTIGDNEPYSGSLVGDTMWQHGTQRGLPHALIEIRQDLIADAAGQAAWAERLARIMQDLAGQPDLDLLPECRLPR